MSSISLTLGLRGRLLSGTQTTLQGALFGNGEPGFTFEPWDITTLFQDRAGTTPVTAAGQSVGLRLDKSKGLALGAELVTNGDFSGGDTGWTPQDANIVLSTSGGAGVATYSATSTFYQGVSVQAGKTYRATAFIKRDSGSGTPFMNFRSGTTLASGTVGEFSGTGYASSSYVFASAWFVAASTTIVYLHFPCTAAATTVVSVDNISVRELPGNHQVAVSDAKRGVYGWMPKTGRRNLLTYTEQFDNAAWVKTLTTVETNSGVAPNGSTTAELITPSSVPNNSYVIQYGNAQTGTLSFYAKEGAARYFIIVRGSYSAGDYAVFDLQSGTITQTPTYAGSTASIVSIGSGWYRCILNSSQVTTINAFSVSGSPTGLSITAPGGILIWGAQLELGSTATAYQRVASQYDITEAGVPTCYYVQADGVDDAYVTPTITPNTDKAQVFAGVRKLVDTVGILMELSASVASNAGTFYFAAGQDVGALGTVNGYSGMSRGSAAAVALQNAQIVQAAPDYAVICFTHDIAGDLSTIRRNGIAGTNGTADKGTGNFLAYPAYIYSRGGTSLPFNGLDFGHAVRFGPNLDAATIARVESLIARNTPEVTL